MYSKPEMKTPTVEMRRERLKNDFSDAAKKATAAVARGNVSMICGGLADGKDLLVRRIHASKFLKKMR